MKIILANRYFYPDQSATSRMVSSLGFALARRGMSVIALASRSLQDSGKTTLPARERIEGVEVHRLATSSFGRHRIAGRASDYATFHLSAAAWLSVHARRGDICVVCTDPPLLSVTATPALKMRGVRLVNWVMDLFPETAMELGIIPRTGAAARSALFLRDWSLGTADLTISPISAMTAYLKQRVGPGGRFATVHHWTNDGEIRPVDPAVNRLREEWGLKDSFVVAYSGNFGRAHDFATLLAAASALRDQPDIRFLMIGDGQQRAATEAAAKRLRLPNMFFKPYQPSSRLAESLSAADIHIVSLLPKLEHCIVPSKFYGVLAAGRPTLFIGDREGEVGRMVRNAACGDVVSPGDPDLLANHILKMRNAPDECERMGTSARHLLHREYTLESGVERWLAAIAHLLPTDAFPAISKRREVAI